MDAQTAPRKAEPIWLDGVQIGEMPNRTAHEIAQDVLMKSGASLWPRHRYNSVQQQINGEATDWLHLFERDGREVRARGGLSYRIPRDAEKEGFALLVWLKAAEQRLPGIGLRVVEIASGFDTVMKMRAEKQVAK